MRKMFNRGWAIVGLLASLASAALAGEAPKAPILLIESGTHTAPVTRIVADKGGRYLLTTSDDKSARLWDAKTGQLVRQFRHPLGAELEGQLSAAAISPDGKLVAIGGFTSAEWDQITSIYVFDLATGKMVRRLAGVGDLINQLAFSPDGSHLASVGSSKEAVNIFRVADWTRVGFDHGFALEAESYRGAFAPDGRFVMSSWDGSLRMYDSSYKKGLAKVQAKSGKRPHGVAVSPNGQWVAVGYVDSTKVDIYSTQNLAHLYSVDTEGISNGNLSSVAWSADGNRLHAAGRFTSREAMGDVASASGIVTWEAQGKGIRSIVHGPANSVLDLNALPDGRLAYSSSTGGWGVIGKAGEKLLEREPVTAYFAGASSAAFRVSPDGSAVGFGFERHRSEPARFNLRERSLLPTATLSDLAAPVAELPTLRLAGLGTTRPTLNGTPLGNLIPNERARAFALHPKGEGVLLGANYGLRYYDTQGKMKWMAAGPAVFAVVVTPDGQKAVAGFGNGTIRWYRLADGKEILSLFPHKDKKRWIMWSPEGYYDASPGGEELIGWHLNQGKDKEARFIPNSQLYDVFYRPDIVQAKFRGEDISGLVTLTAEQALKRPPPEVAFTKVPSSSANAKEKVCYKITSTGGGIGEVRLFQNGKLVKSDGFYREAVAKREDKMQLAAATGETVYRSLRGLKMIQKEDSPTEIAKSKGESVEECQEIDAIPGDNELGVVAFNAPNTVQSSMATGNFTSSRKAEAPQLYVLGIGIDEFADKTANLKYAAKDASDFRTLMQQKAGTLFDAKNIKLVPLANAQATKQGILKAIDELAATIKPWDSFILFVASHGVMLGNQYYLVSSGYDGTANTANLIGSNEIVELSKKIRALNQLYVFDTCHAGGVDNIMGGLYDARMSVLAKKMGLHIYASAGGLQEALDGYQGNGLFTHTLLNSMRDPAGVDADKDGKVSVVELGKSAKDKTTAISSKIGHPQTPTMIHFGQDVAVFGVR